MSKRTKKGHLNKQHGGFGKKNTWNLYFFEMIGGVYFHYYKGNSKNPAHQLMVNDIVKVCASSKGTSNTFEVHFRGSGSPWILDAGSEEEMISWMEVLHPESSKPVVEMIQQRQKVKELSRAKEVQSLSSTWSPGQFQSASIKQQFSNHGNQMAPHIDQTQHSNYPSQFKQPPPVKQRSDGDHYSPVDPRYIQVSHSYPAGQLTGVPQHPRLDSPRPGECSTENPLLQHCPVQGPQHQHWQPQSPPRHLSSPTEEPDTSVPTARVDGVPVAKPRTKVKSYPVPSLQQSRSVSQAEIEPSDDPMDIKHRRANTDIRRSVSPQPYEVFRQVKADQQGISDSSGYVVMKGGDNGTTSPEPVNTGDNQIDGQGDNMTRPMVPEDVFRYFDSSQLSHLAKLFRQMSAAQGKEAPLTESGQLDKDAVVQAITGISDELLEDSGQLDSIGECTEEEEDLTSLDEMSQQAFTIQKEWLSEFNPIGKGAFGEVFHTLLRYAPGAKPIEVAVKTVKPSASKVDRENFNKEVQIMATLLHPNVVKMFGVIEDPENDTVRVVLEFLHKGDLRTYLQKSKTKPSVKHLVKFMFDVASGMHYIASKGLVHRDLAARNVLVSNDEVCKVADFGLLRHVEGEQELYRAQSSLRLPARWMAPECLSDLCFSLATDVWSFGILMWEMFHPEEKYPYPSLKNQAVMIKVPQGYTMDIPEEAPPTVHKLMKQCWHLNPENRPSFLLISTLLCKCHLQLV